MRDKWITDWPTSQRFPHYTRANAGEVLADPVSPLGWSFGWDGGIVQGYKDGLIRIGAYEDADFDPEHPESVACFGGYFYINLSAIRMQGVRNPAATVEALDQAFFGDHPDVPAYVAHPDDEKPHLTSSINAHTEWVMSGVAWPELDDDRTDAAALRASRGDLASYSDSQLVDRARRVQSKLPHLFAQHVVSGSSAAVAPGLLGVVAAAINEPNLPMALLSSIGDVDSADANYALWALSRLVRDDATLMKAFDSDLDNVLDVASASFLKAWDEFIVEFGSRGPDEWDLRSPTWETHPQLLLAALDRVRLQSDAESPHVRHAQKAAQRDDLIRGARVALAQNEEVAPLLDLGLSAGKMMAHRERTKTTIVRVLHEARVAFRELGRRHGHDELIFQLLDDELDAYLASPASFDQPLRERHGEWMELFALEPPFIIANATVAPLNLWPHKDDNTVAVASAGDVLTGVAGSPGVARGIARVILDPASPGELGPGDILVAPCTDPSWTPLFMTSAAVVVNVGGQISHAVIVSRELGVPCVVSVNDATKRIPDGALIEVDGNTGSITIVQ